MPDPWNGVPPGEWAEQVTDTLLGWLTGPDSGQNDGIMDAIALIRALSADLAAQIAAAVMAEREIAGQTGAAVCEDWARMDADIGALKAATVKLLGPDWPDDGLTALAARELAACRQHTAQALAHAVEHAIRSRPAPAGVDALEAVRRAAYREGWQHREADIIARAERMDMVMVSKDALPKHHHFVSRQDDETPIFSLDIIEYAKRARRAALEEAAALIAAGRTVHVPGHGGGTTTGLPWGNAEGAAAIRALMEADDAE